MPDTATKPRDIDLPASYARNDGRGPGGYPTGNPRDKVKARQYAAYTRALWDEQEEYMASLHKVWTRNLLYLSGRQWWQETDKGGFRPSRVAAWREQPVTNLTMAFFRNYLAKALKNRPAWTVVPASTEPDDIYSADLGDKALEAKWQELRLARVLRSAVSWTIATGNGFIYPFWNSNTGRMIISEAIIDVPKYDEYGVQVGTEEAKVMLDEDGEPQLLSNGMPDPGAEPHYIDEGDVGLRSLSPFQVRVNPEAQDDDDLQWVIISEVRSLRELAITHPELVNQIVPEAVESADLDRALTSMSGLMGGDNTRLTEVRDTRAEHLDSVIVLHFHEKPCSDYPQGRYWQATRDVLLEDPQDLPEGVWPPIVHFEDVVIPGRYYASSVIEQVIPINKAYNEINGQVREHHNLMAKGKWLVPRGSGIRQGMITNAPGEVIQFNPGFKPEQAQIASLPSTIIEERNRVYSDFEIVSGIQRVSMGKAPPGVVAGVAFLQLQEADDTDLGPLLENLESGVAQTAGIILQIMKERYTTDRLIYIVGENQKYEVRSFKGSDLKGAVDVRPQAGSSFPWSKTAQQSMLLTLAAQMPQLFNNQETGQFDAAKFARLLPIGGLGNMGNDGDLDVQEALREEEQFELLGTEDGGNEVPQVGFWQNHDIHYLQHVQVLKSAAFKKWPPQGQQAFMQHVQQTQQERDQKAAQSAQMQAMAQGNAPKELYQQGGPGAGPTAPPNLTPDDISNMSPDQVAALKGLPDTPWVDTAQQNFPPPPAQADLMKMAE